MKLFKKKEPLVKNVGLAKTSIKPANSAKKSNAKGKALHAWIYQPVLLLTFCFGLAYLMMEWLFLQPVEKQHQEALINLSSLSLKQKVDAYILDKKTDILLLASHELTRSNTVVLSEDESALTSRNGLSSETLDINKRQQSLKVIWPELEQLYLISVDHLVDDLTDANQKYASLSIASADLLRRTSENSKTTIEAFFDQDKWHLQIASPVLLAPDSKVVSKVLLAIFELTELKKLLRIEPGLPKGETAIVGAGDRVIITQGSGDASSAKLLPTLISQWKVRFSPVNDQLPILERLFVWAVLGLFCLVAVIGVSVVCRLNINKVRRDMQLATQTIIKYFSDDSRASSSFVFGESYAMSDAILNRLSKSKAEAKAREKSIKDESQVKQKKQDDKASLDDAPLFDDDLLDLDVLAESNDQHEPEPVISNEMVTEDKHLDLDIPQSIFRAYDIRGIVDETLNDELVELLGKAIASEALSQGQKAICVGYDGRLSSVGYCQALTKGIVSTGIDAIIVGQVPTPVLYFATHHFDTGSGVMITGSHNPKNYNGFKMMIDGATLSGDEIQKLYNRLLLQDFAVGEGSASEQVVAQDYIDTILNDIAVASPLKVVLDAGNGVAGGIAPELIEELGCEVIPLHCDVDGNFPNHHPDPGKPENLQDLIAAVREHEADIGLAFDGDGDRLGVVTNTGKIIWPDRLLMLFAKDVVSRNPGADIIFDVKCSRRLNGLISSYGGRPIMWKTGHSLIKAKMKETGALLAGEMSGHIFFKERWFGFDDGLYSAARLLEVLGIEDRSSDDVFADFPEDVSTPEINITVTDESKFELIDKLCALKEQFAGGNVSTIDGLRVDYPNGWGLCRASNTTPVLVLRFEADTDAALEEIKNKFIVQLKAVDASLDCNF
jgi:phosphomannomutase/phosphoglucomutase